MDVDVKDGFIPSGFIDRMMAENRLLAAGFDCFVFLPGMGFGSMEKWWPPAGRRTFSHEGIDLFLFRTRGNVLFRLDETIRVPLIHPGEIVGLIPDFLGHTVIARHRKPGSGREDEFYTLYGHVAPDASLAVGDKLNGGEIFARIADVDGRSTRLPAHLHISAAWCRRLPPVDTLTWPLLNRTDRAAFIDPMDLLGIAFETINPAQAGPLHRIPKCGSA
jgi:hypothetical protein